PVTVMVALLPAGRPSAETSSVPMVGGASISNVAVAAAAALRVTGHGPAPGQAPLPPGDRGPGVATACSVTWVSAVKLVEHEAPQSRPSGSLLTTPDPVPFLVTVRTRVCALCPFAVNDCSGPLNVAPAVLTKRVRQKILPLNVGLSP